jgi:hypothetical protein
MQLFGSDRSLTSKEGNWGDLVCVFLGFRLPRFRDDVMSTITIICRFLVSDTTSAVPASSPAGEKVCRQLSYTYYRVVAQPAE